MGLVASRAAMRRVCLERGCYRYAMVGSPRCAFCRRKWDAARQAKRGDLYKGDYRARRAATIAEQGYCTYCGSTSRLTADHVNPGDPASPLVTACLSCNVKRANRARARKPQGVWGGG